MVKDVIRIVCLLLITVVCHGQTISFRTEKGWKLDRALLALSAQSGVNIAFNPDDADDITVAIRSFANQPLESIVKTLLNGTGLDFRLKGNRLVVFKTAATRPERIPPPPPVATRVIVSGHVLSEDGTALPSASIRLKELNQFFTTDAYGNFNMILSGVNTFTLEISYVGYQQQTRKVEKLDNDTILPVVFLKEVSLRLKDIAVTANRTFDGSSNSSLMITREMIEQTPALSLNDLLNQIPNRTITAPSLQNVQNINLRANFAATTNGKGDYELANAFGVAIIMDGNNITNNLNMQTRNPGYTGAGNAFITSGNSWGLNGNNAGSESYTGDYTYGGTDLRQIPPDNIESIEVVSGVASAKYGDLTDGAIIIERQAGISKGYFRTQLRDQATSASFSKGFRLSPKAGVMNASFSYVNSYFDSREKLKAYERINGNIIWTNYYGKNKRIKSTTIMDYGRNLDGIKRDPDDPASPKVRFDSWNFSVANRINYRVNGRFVKNIGVNLRYSEGHQYSYREYDVNFAYVLYTLATTIGIHEGTYAPGIYTAQSIIDGRPVSFTGSLDVSNEFHTGSINHFLTIGGNYNYGRNKGLGQLADPSIPRPGAYVRPNSSAQSMGERYYDYSRIVPQQDVGFYAEDVFKTMIADKYLHVRAGGRLDIQNGKVSGSPRINTNYEVNKSLRVGLAYGLAFKSPALAQRYPGPSFQEISLLNAYNGKEAESMSLIYVNRYDATNKNLRPAKSQTLEASAQYRKNGFNLSGNVYAKWNKNGITTVSEYYPIELPVYSATYVEGSKPIVTQDSTRKYLLSQNSFQNVLKSYSQGIELIVSTPAIRAIATSFTIAAGINSTNYKTTIPTWRSKPADVTTTLPDYALMGLYPPTDETTTFSNARITSVTHIPKISLIVQFIAECTLISKTNTAAENGVPIAYRTNGYDYVAITKFDKDDPRYGYLYQPQSELNSNSAPNPQMNFHMSVGKEIRKRFRFSFNVYNVFNYQPYYQTSSNSYIFPNSAPTFGAELSVKI